jgi:uncharacterized protein (TIGR02147 family)
MPPSRPVIFDFAAPHLFLKELMGYYKVTRDFSLRERTKLVTGCSQALASQILAGRRNLTRDQLPAIEKLFDLTVAEVSFVDELLRAQRLPKESPEPKRAGARAIPKNHLLASWWHPYVKDLIFLRGFKQEVPVLQRMLTGILSLKQIEMSIEFLQREGFWRKTTSGKLVIEDDLTVTTNDIPNDKIKAFHKKALQIAIDGMDKFPVGNKRKSSTTLLAVSESSSQELRDLIQEFHVRLQNFIDDHPNDKPADELVQVAIHLTPIGVKNDLTK